MRRLARVVRQDRRDEGMTLVELIVAMGIFLVVISVFMGGVVIMTRGTVRADVTAASGDSVRNVFQRLERQVRYAESINYPGTGASGARYVEFRTSAKVSTTGDAMCTQWRWVPSTGQLQSRTWRDAASTVVPGWTTVVTDVLADSSTSGRPYPFQVHQAIAAKSQPRQRLTLRLTVGNPQAPAGVDSETVFVARNSSVASVSNADLDNNGQSDSQVCLALAGRP